MGSEGHQDIDLAILTALLKGNICTFVDTQNSLVYRSPITSLFTCLQNVPVKLQLKEGHGSFIICLFWGQSKRMLLLHLFKCK